jgi:hypothetical protein
MYVQANLLPLCWEQLNDKNEGIIQLVKGQTIQSILNTGKSIRDNFSVEDLYIKTRLVKVEFFTEISLLVF